jgi:hypothetical protein
LCLEVTRSLWFLAPFVHLRVPRTITTGWYVMHAYH